MKQTKNELKHHDPSIMHYEQWGLKSKEEIENEIKKWNEQWVKKSKIMQLVEWNAVWKEWLSFGESFMLEWCKQKNKSHEEQIRWLNQTFEAEDAWWVFLTQRVPESKKVATEEWERQMPRRSQTRGWELEEALKGGWNKKAWEGFIRWNEWWGQEFGTNIEAARRSETRGRAWVEYASQEWELKFGGLLTKPKDWSRWKEKWGQEVEIGRTRVEQYYESGGFEGRLSKGKHEEDELKGMPACYDLHHNWGLCSWEGEEGLKREMWKMVVESGGWDQGEYEYKSRIEGIIKVMERYENEGGVLKNRWIQKLWKEMSFFGWVSTGDDWIREKQETIIQKGWILKDDEGRVWRWSGLKENQEEEWIADWTESLTHVGNNEFKDRLGGRLKEEWESMVWKYKIDWITNGLMFSGGSFSGDKERLMLKGHELAMEGAHEECWREMKGWKEGRDRLMTVVNNGLRGGSLSWIKDIQKKGWHGDEVWLGIEGLLDWMTTQRERKRWVNSMSKGCPQENESQWVQENWQEWKAARALLRGEEKDPEQDIEELRQVLESFSPRSIFSEKGWGKIKEEIMKIISQEEALAFKKSLIQQDLKKEDLKSEEIKLKRL